MLGESYQLQLQSLLDDLPCQLTLPPDQQDFFSISGAMPIVTQEQRGSVRRRIRTVGICFFEPSIQAISRSAEPFKIFTRDMSRNSLGISSPVQIYPGEVIRILLPSLWIRIVIRRCQRVAHQFYDVGGSLESRHEPSSAAFDIVTVNGAASF